MSELSLEGNLATELSAAIISDDAVGRFRGQILDLIILTIFPVCLLMYRLCLRTEDSTRRKKL